MIRLTRLNGKEFFLNGDLIKCIESTPDTLITLMQGDKIMVLEEIEVIIQEIIQYRKKLYQDLVRKNKGE